MEKVYDYLEFEKDKDVRKELKDGKIIKTYISLFISKCRNYPI